MNLKYRTKGFVFKKDDMHESDRVFSVFTQDFGRLEVFGKAIRKITSKLRGGIDIFSFSEIEFIQGKSRKTLTDTILQKKFDNIIENAEKLKIVYKISEVLDNFIKGQEKDFETFNLLSEFLGKLGDNSVKIKNHQLAYQYFFWNFLSLQGYKLEVNNCAACQSKLNPYNVCFSGKDGGIICKKCLPEGKVSQKINSDIVKILRLVLKKDWEMISKLKIEPSSQKLLEDISESAVDAFCPVRS